MAKKKYKITKSKFLDWLISDREDVEYWGGRFIKELKENHTLNVTTVKLFKEKDSLPAHLFEDQMTEQEIEDMIGGADDVPIEEIMLIL